MDSQILIVVPVKECSTRVPGKNLRPLCGLPLFLYAVSAAKRAAEVFNEIDIPATVTVVTESPRVGVLASDYGVGLSPYNDKKLAQDPHQVADACLYAVWYNGDKFKDVIMVQPSNPFVIMRDIIVAYDLYLAYWQRHPVRTVKEVKKQVWSTQGSDRYIYPVPGPVFVGTGSVVVCSVEYLKQNGGFVGATIPCYAGADRAIDIDTEADFAVADQAMTAIMQKGVNGESNTTCTGAISVPEGRG